MAICKYGLSPITGSHNHWWDDKEAECTRCKKVLPHSEFHKGGARARRNGLRPIYPTCRPCTSDIVFQSRRKDMKRFKYRLYGRTMREEGNDCDITYEEFLEKWPWDNKCPILGHELNVYPKEERGKWIGGRHYPYTPCVDHIDPRLDMSKDNLEIICWRANELKSDAIPAEIHLLHIHMKDVFSIGDEVFEDMGYKNTLRETGWIGKYANMQPEGGLSGRDYRRRKYSDMV